MYYDEGSQLLIRAAAAKARTMGHSCVGSVHFLLALAAQPGFPGVLLRGNGLDCGTLQMMASVLYGAGTADLPLPQGFTSHARRLLREAGSEARFRGSRAVQPTHILLALLRSENTAAAQLLAITGVDRDVLFTRAVEHTGTEQGVKGRGSQRSCWSNSVRICC